MNTFFKSTFIALSLTASSMANAAFETYDWKVEGDELVVHDDSTGLEWLNLKKTNFHSINSIQEEFEVYGDFAGWRLATASEVESLFSSLYGSVTFDSNGQYRADGIAVPFSDVFNWTTFEYVKVGGETKTILKSYGLYANDDNTTVNTLGAVRELNYSQLESESPAGNLDYKKFGMGVFIVSDGGVTLSSINAAAQAGDVESEPSAADVPAPFVLGSLALGIMGFSRRNRQSD